MTPNHEADGGPFAAVASASLAAAAAEAKTALDNGWVEGTREDKPIESLTDEQLVEELHGHNPMAGYRGWLGHNRQLDTTAERQALRNTLARYRATGGRR